jgi:hypothetical protein
MLPSSPKYTKFVFGNVLSFSAVEIQVIVQYVRPKRNILPSPGDFDGDLDQFQFNLFDNGHVADIRARCICDERKQSDGENESEGDNNLNEYWRDLV